MAGADHIEGGVEKMKRAGRKLIGMAAAWLLAASAFSMAVYAADGFSSEYERLLDTANILSDEEQDEITELLDELSERQKMDVTIATVENLDGYNSIEACADDLYDYCNFGYGTNRDGLMFVVSMEEREWHISTCGYGITAFTDAGCDYIAEQFKSSLSDGEYEKAFEIYIDQCDAFVTQAREDRPYDNSNLPKKPLGMIWIPVALVLGFICAFLIVGGMKRQLKTVARKTTAGNYQKKGSLKVTESSDLFLYEDITRTAKPKSSDGDSGSSTHTSSSGETHGGSSGKF